MTTCHTSSKFMCMRIECQMRETMYIHKNKTFFTQTVFVLLGLVQNTYGQELSTSRLSVTRWPTNELPTLTQEQSNRRPITWPPTELPTQKQSTKGPCRSDSKITEEQIQKAARVIFGQARGEPQKGQLAVAYTIVNRIKHSGYPNTLNKVIDQKFGGIHQYYTLDDLRHDMAWAYAREQKTQEYKNAMKAARDALCTREKDPTYGATDFCAMDPCRATSDNKYWCAVNKIKIGNHWFVGREEKRTRKNNDCKKRKLQSTTGPALQGQSSLGLTASVTTSQQKFTTGHSTGTTTYKQTTKGPCGNQTKYTEEQIQKVARVVFGEARGEPQKGQLAVAYTIVNRIKHSGYPNTLNKVVDQKYGGIHQYETLDDKRHDIAWAYAREQKNQEYKNAMKAARDALCTREKDPTHGATDFCAMDPCRATSDNKYWCAVNKIKIRNHWFVGREKRTKKNNECNGRK